MRPVRCLLIVTALALTLHLWMLAGHGGPALPLMPAGYAADSIVQHQPSTTESAQASPGGGVGMAATCLAVLTAMAASLLLASGRRAAGARGPAQVRLMAAGRERTSLPRCRSPVELGVSRT